jgi:hypothetical protein
LGGGASGGQSASGSTNGGSGGKGIVILRTPDTDALANSVTGASITFPTGFIVYTFNDSGTIKWGA